MKFAALHPHSNGRHTHFLALDKCLKGRDYLQILQLNRPNKEPLPSSDKKPVLVTIEHDLDWLAVLKLTEDKLLDPQLIYKFENRKMVHIDKQLLQQFSERFKEVRSKLELSFAGKLAIPESLFRQTVLAGPGSYRTPDSIKINNQTEGLLKLLDINKDKFRNVLFYNNEKAKYVLK